MRSIATLIAIYAAITISMNAAGTYVYSIPSCPPNLVLKVYTFNPQSKKIQGILPIAKGYKDVFDAKQYLITNGMHFPENGYALYFKNNNFLIIVTDRENQDQAEFILD